MGRGKGIHTQPISVLQKDLEYNRKKYKGDDLLRRNYICDRIYRLSDNPTEDIEKIRVSSNKAAIHDLLLFEYKEVLPQYEGQDYSLEYVLASDIEPSNKNHFEILDPKRVEIYKTVEPDVPRGVIRKIGTSRFRIIDGHHRLKAVSPDEEVLVFVLKGAF